VIGKNISYETFVIEESLIESKISYISNH